MSEGEAMSKRSPEDIAAARANLAKAWEETQEYARNTKLDKFLDKPLELNRWIIRMVALLDKIQFSEKRHDYEEQNVHIEKSSVYVTKYPQGKFTLCFTGNGEYDEEAQRAFRSAVDVYAILSHDKFIQSMRQQNIADEVITEYLRDYHIMDDCYATERIR